ncbi:MAG: hypothetical protein Hyperionvirus1_141 [Hyperionvirus sp.]|uniref:Uncharacterized protein n=1 Tax=Hyperionvirus sp. TaxID=2487770 RepID=A0A3G5A6B1_9VIRU|nr:MAG: hypothetical protein Hyperionvirus1_141 [Hyperionvirus sp.]
MAIACPKCVVLGYPFNTEQWFCIECKEMVASKKYCNKCADRLNKCYGCGNDVKACREYLSDFKIAFEKDIKGWNEFANREVLGFRKMAIDSARKKKGEYEMILKFFNNDEPASETKKVIRAYLNHLLRTNNNK